jgi:hypothetical protein
MREVRLLVLYPGSSEEPLTGDIVEADLERRPLYDALSYTWADESGDSNRSEIFHCVKEDSKQYHEELRCRTETPSTFR